jgi:hypothetical protein
MPFGLCRQVPYVRRQEAFDGFIDETIDEVLGMTTHGDEEEELLVGGGAYSRHDSFYEGEYMPDTQHVNYDNVASHFSPGRAVNLSGPPFDGSSEMEDPCLHLTPMFNKTVVDFLDDECPQADLGGGKIAPLLSFAARIKAGSVPVGDRYKGYLEVYRFAGSTHDYGRLYCLNGSQSVMGKVRRHLFYGVYEDIDIANAQPTMMRQMMTRIGYKGPSNRIAEYVDNRDECLQLVVDGCTKPITKDDAKNFFISTLFGSNLRTWEHAHGAVETDVRELLLIPWEREVSAFVDFYIGRFGDEIARYDKKTDEQIRAEGKSVAHRRFSLAMQNEERLVMQCAIEFVRSIRGASVGVLVHDGIFASVPGGAESILAELSDYVYEKSSYNLSFVVKSLEPTEPIGDLVLLLKGSQTNIQLPEYDTKVSQDCRFADAFYQINKEKLLFNSVGELFHYGDGSYAQHGRGIWHLGAPPGEWWDNIFPDTPYSQDANKVLTMARILKSRYPQHRQRIKWELYGDHWIPLRDCLVCLSTGETRAFSPTLCLSRKVDLPYVPDALTAPEYAPQVKDLYADMARLYDGDAALQAACEELIAYSAFTRGNPLKKVVNMVGDGNNGKSTFLQRVMHLLGPSFTTTMDAKHLIGRSDPTRPNPSLCAALGCNMVMVEEPSKDELMDGAQVKEYSGNTQVKCRQLYSNGAVEQPNNMVIFINSNHAVQFKNPDKALLARIERIHMPCKFFRNEAERCAALDQIECLIERTACMHKFHVGDPNFSRRYESLKMRQVYFAFLKLQYKNYVERGSLAEVPDAYSYRGCEEEELEPEADTIYEELVEETGADTDYMSGKALCALLKAKNTIALGRKMKERIRKSTKVRSGRKNKTHGYFGIRPRNQGGAYGAAYGATYDPAGPSGFY